MKKTVFLMLLLCAGMNVSLAQINAPTLSSPSNGATLSSSVRSKLEWSSVTGAAHYIVSIDTVPSFDSPECRTATTTSTSYTWWYLKFATKYYWRVCATNDNDTDTSAWSAVRYFTTCSTVTLASPSNGSTLSSSVRPKLEWSSVTGAAHYIVSIDTVPSFDSPECRTATTTSTSYTWWYLKFATRYYWRVCATNDNDTDTSAWSAVRSFTTCSTVTLASPSNGSTLSSSVRPKLEWSSVTGAAHYIVSIDTVPSFDSPECRTGTATSTSYTWWYLKFNTKYYWRVCATNDNDTDTSAWSAVRSFTTCSTVSLSSPSNGATLNSSVQPTFQWSSVTGAAHYILSIDTVPTFDSPEYLTATTTSTSRSLNLKFATKYYWRVCATNDNDTDTSAWSAVRSFTTASKVTLSSPSNGAALSSTTDAVFTWDVIIGAAHYIQALDTVSTFDSPAYRTITWSGNDILSTSKSVHINYSSQFKYGTTYYWRVCATNYQDADTSAWSAVRRCTTAYQLTTGPTLVSPANDSSDIDFQSVLALQWDELANVNGYRYQVSTSSDFSTLFAQGTTAQTTASIHNLRPATTYYWRVQGYNGVGNSVWSAVWHFTTDGCPPIGTSFSHEICEGELPYHYVNGDIDTTFEVGTPQLSTLNFQLLTPLGCDSTVTLHLIVHPTVTSTSSVTVCESDLPYHYVNGDIDTTFEVGTPQLSTFNFQLLTQHGCDSTVILTLNVRSANYTELTETACGNYTWNDEVYEESGDYVQTFTNAAGCDSVVTLHLTIFTANYADFADNACGSYTWNGEVYEESGDYVQTFTNVNGCDSVVTLHLTIFTANYADFADNACGSYTWNNEVYEESGDYVQTFTNMNGCDSVVTLHLTIFTANYADFAETACGSYTWNDEVYTESGDYVQTFTNAHGCDSVVTLHLTINQPVVNETYMTACDEYEWNGETLTASGDYTATFTAANGCDSTVTLHLTINQPVVNETYMTACDEYEWNGETLTASGDYTATFTAANGCDSTVTLHLTIHPAVTELVEVTLCESDLPYHYINGDIDTTFEVGTPQLSTFNFQLLTQHGCDSTVILTLTIDSCDTNGINENGIVNLTLYPNPTTGMVNVQFTMNNEQSGAGEIQVLDVYGRLLDAVDISDARGASVQAVQINLSRYATGIYFVRLVNGGKVMAARKVVRE